MGKSISFFNPYSKGENQVTNYCGLMLKILYKESPEAFEKIINDFISNTGKSFECLPDFSQQKKKRESIPDLCFSQKSCCSLHGAIKEKLSDDFRKKAKNCAIR